MLTIPSHFARAVLRGAERLGIDSGTLLQELGISPAVYQEDQGIVHADQFVRLVQRAWEASGDEFLGMSGTRCIPGHFALMVRYVCQFDTLEALLKEIVRYYQTTREDVAFRVDIGDEQVSFHIDLVNPEFDIDHYLTEFLMITMHRFMCWITGQRIYLDSASFQYIEPAHVASYQSLFPCPRKFLQNSNTFYFSSRYLSLPLVRDWPEIKAYLKHSPADLMLIPGSDNRYSTRIKSFMLEQQRGGKGIPDFNKVAEELCVSVPTLRRKLQAEDTSFQQLKDVIRRDLAIDKLVRERLPVATIGEQLGFVEPASFTRAFKQWTGVSPGEYRLNAQS